jgi:hypothetical protein
MNNELKNICRKAVMALFNVICRYLPGIAEDNQSGQPVSRQRFEVGFKSQHGALKTTSSLLG